MLASPHYPFSLSRQWLAALLRPGRIVLAKLVAALRVSTVLTFLLTEQLLLAYVLLPELRNLFWTLFAFLAIIATTCLATSTIGLLCSALSRKTTECLSRSRSATTH